MVKPRTHRPQPQANSLKIRHVLGTILVAALIAGGLIGWQWLQTARLGPRLTALVVRGDFKRVDPAAVRAVLKPYLGGGFFRVDLDSIRAAVVAMPWVADAAVRLEWPATLKVDLREQRAVARWNGADLVNANGAVFAHRTPAGLADLPALSGPDDAAAPDVLSAFAHMNALLKRDRLALAGLSLDARGAWIARLDDGIELRLGREQAIEHLRRFIEIVPRVLGTRLAAAAYVDMRYTNGFAVGWKNKSDMPTTGAGNA